MQGSWTPSPSLIVSGLYCAEQQSPGEIRCMLGIKARTYFCHIVWQSYWDVVQPIKGAEWFPILFIISRTLFNSQYFNIWSTFFPGICWKILDRPKILPLQSVNWIPQQFTETSFDSFRKMSPFRMPHLLRNSLHISGGGSALALCVVTLKYGQPHSRCWGTFCNNHSCESIGSMDVCYVSLSQKLVTLASTAETICPVQNRTFKLPPF